MKAIERKSSSGYDDLLKLFITRSSDNFDVVYKYITKDNVGPLNVVWHHFQKEPDILNSTIINSYCFVLTNIVNISTDTDKTNLFMFTIVKVLSAIRDCSPNSIFMEFNKKRNKDNKLYIVGYDMNVLLTLISASTNPVVSIIWYGAKVVDVPLSEAWIYIIMSYYIGNPNQKIIYNHFFYLFR